MDPGAIYTECCRDTDGNGFSLVKLWLRDSKINQHDTGATQYKLRESRKCEEGGGVTGQFILDFAGILMVMDSVSSNSDSGFSLKKNNSIVSF